MITAFVQFSLPHALSPAEASEIFSTTAPKYMKMKGLLRKYYILSQDGLTAGGVYLWKSREDAEQVYTEQWKRFIHDTYGADPSVTYFATPVVVDNTLGEIITED